MNAIKIKITSFVSNNKVGFVEYKFYEAFNKEYNFSD